jgi:hypothetical protein
MINNEAVIDCFCLSEKDFFDHLYFKILNVNISKQKFASKKKIVRKYGNFKASESNYRRIHIFNLVAVN